MEVFMDTRNSGTTKECAPLRFEIGDQVLDMVVPGLMLAIKLMAVGEVARVRVDQRYAYGSDGFPPKVSADTDVEFEVELISIRDMEAVIDAMEEADVVEHGLRYKVS
jgi:FKBP-type peptidyl-prolyl cis-trans isomerase 2